MAVILRALLVRHLTHIGPALGRRGFHLRHIFVRNIEPTFLSGNKFSLVMRYIPILCNFDEDRNNSSWFVIPSRGTNGIPLLGLMEATLPERRCHDYAFSWIFLIRHADSSICKGQCWRNATRPLHNVNVVREFRACAPYSSGERISITDHYTDSFCPLPSVMMEPMLISDTLYVWAFLTRC